MELNFEKIKPPSELQNLQESVDKTIDSWGKDAEKSSINIQKEIERRITENEIRQNENIFENKKSNEEKRHLESLLEKLKELDHKKEELEKVYNEAKDKNHRLTFELKTRDENFQKEDNEFSKNQTMQLSILAFIFLILIIFSLFF